jgi:hypothetical protein
VRTVYLVGGQKAYKQNAEAMDALDLVILYVTNRGDADTMITNMVLFEIGSWWRLLLFKITSSMS